MSQVLSSVAVVSGASTITVVSGHANLLDVMPYFLSGQGSPTSLSGKSVAVYDAVSGIANPDISGSIILYRFDFGSHSGFTQPAASLITPLHASDMINANSGIVAVSVAGMALTIVYSK